MLLDDLRAALPEGCLIDDPNSIAAFVHDQAEWAEYGAPIAVVRPTTALDVQAVVRACIAHRVPVVPRGAGTGLSGGANAVDGCVVISFDRMDRILEINAIERLAVVEPGVVNDRLREVSAEHGLWYPPDPASSPWSTLGGNVATNAGGICCVKYGVTSDYVLALEVVTGTGEIVRIGRRTAKGVAGYDLAHLLVGSEGTLGIITEITVKLRPQRLPEHTVAGHFSSIVDAGRAVAAVSAAGVVPSAFELIDRHFLEAVDAWKNMGLATDADALLLARCDSAGAAGDEEAKAILACFRKSGATWAERSTDQIEADALFEARRLAYPALERLGHMLTEDVCVPKAALPEMLMRIQSISEKHEVMVANVAHVGDGNLHPVLVIAAGDDAARVRSLAAFDDILDAAIALGGTVTGEHGVGVIKRDGFTREVSAGTLAMNHAVKDALDPHGILNPGKVLKTIQPALT